MSAVAPQSPSEVDLFAVADHEIDAVLEEAGGDAREAIRMLLRDLAVMAADADAAASRGFLRGRFSEGWRRPRTVDEL
ncbi:hypothetical protein FQV39_21230 [Bosea sp. F3-2]|uniref:hypothetical protein n=1 Tax=Bosea sp. F3-2 TaxID=2599640 RepID=UPI0011F0559A|nr:hypothetical protein [Bosea sp. F3-2]QEL24825.1 hypothetical protein FQV39_21230 [Bosea sp. F3-2]